MKFLLKREKRCGGTSLGRGGKRRMVVGEGFEPSKAKPADLQSAPVDRLGILPMLKHAEKRLIHHFTNCKIGK